jgi:hypothetical protein
MQEGREGLTNYSGLFSHSQSYWHRFHRTDLGIGKFSLFESTGACSLNFTLGKANHFAGLALLSTGGKGFEQDMETHKSYHMKTICTIGLFLMFSFITQAQDNAKQGEREKEEKSSHKNKQDDEKIDRHEKIIWAGTGINMNDKAKDVKNAPEAVIASFRQFFPDQPIDNVRKYRGLYAITFSNPTYTTTFIYKADGTFVEARTVATDSIVPSIVKEKVKRSKGEYTPNDVVMIEKANKQKYYRFHVKKNNKSEYVVYSEQGEEVEYDY